jgi:hypothetical protein
LVIDATIDKVYVVPEFGNDTNQTIPAGSMKDDTDDDDDDVFVVVVVVVDENGDDTTVDIGTTVISLLDRNELVFVVIVGIVVLVMIEDSNK